MFSKQTVRVIALLKHKHTHTLASVAQREEGVTGQSRAVVFVSVSGENSLSGTSKINTLTATCVCLVRRCRRDATELKEAPILVM